MLFVAILMLLTLTLIGFLAIDTSLVEMKAAGNSRFSTREIYLVDGANHEVASYINASAWPVLNTDVSAPLTTPNDTNNPGAWPDNQIADPGVLAPLPNRDRGLREAYNYRVLYNKADTAGNKTGVNVGLVDHLYDVQTVRNDTTRVKAGYKRLGTAGSSGIGE